MEWFYLVIAGGLEVFWSTCLKFSEGFTVLKFTILTVIGMIFSFVFLSQATKVLPRLDRHRSPGRRDRRYRPFSRIRLSGEALLRGSFAHRDHRAKGHLSRVSKRPDRMFLILYLVFRRLSPWFSGVYRL